MNVAHRRHRQLIESRNGSIAGHFWETARIRARWYYRGGLGRHEGLYMMADRLRAWLDPRFAELVVTPRTDLVVEGFPRSANTFAAVAVRVAQPQPVRVACRRHAVAQVARAARLRIPCVICIRSPRDALISAYIAEGGRTDLRYAMKCYLRFHEDIMSYRDSFLIARFETITASPNAFIRRINSRFGTNFQELLEDAGTRKIIKDRVDEFQRPFWNDRRINPFAVSRPAPERWALRDQAAEAVHTPKLACLLLACISMYDELRDQADV